jgi:hypothetical protein
LDKRAAKPEQEVWVKKSQVGQDTLDTAQFTEALNDWIFSSKMKAKGKAKDENLMNQYIQEEIKAANKAEILYTRDWSKYPFPKLPTEKLANTVLHLERPKVRSFQMLEPTKGRFRAHNVQQLKERTEPKAQADI